MYIFFLILICLSNIFYLYQRIKLYNIENYSICPYEYKKLLTLTTILFAPYLYLSYSSCIGLIVLGYIVIECSLIAFVDLKYCEITHSSIFLLSVLSVMYLILHNQLSVNHLISGITLFTLFFIFYLFFNVGGGDVKLAFAIGVFLKPYHLIDYLLLIFTLSLITSVISLMYCKKKKLNTKEICIPFAPFMIIGLFCYLII